MRTGEQGAMRCKKAGGAELDRREDTEHVGEVAEYGVASVKELKPAPWLQSRVAPCAPS